MRHLLPTVLMALGCTGPRPDVVLVVIDTLRWDAMSMNGAPYPSTPNFDRLAARSRTYDRGYASSSWTLASTASLLTGRHPANHGVVDPARRLPEAAETLAEHLKGRDYTTTSVVSNPLVAHAQQLLAGFDNRHHRLDDFGSTADALTELALEALAPDRRDFVYIHYMDPHYPYLNHPGLDWAPAEGAGRLKGGEDIKVLRGLELTPEELEFVQACYLEEVHATDKALGRLVDNLDENTLLIVTSDHGEEFLERGWLGHVRTVHEEMVHVPLLVHGPGIAPARLSEPTLNGGAFATVSAVLDTWAPGGLQIPDLLGPPAPGVFVEVDYDPQTIKYTAKAAHKQAWITKDRKLLRDLDANIDLVFDLSTDPQERSPTPATDLSPLLRAHAEASEDALDHSVGTADEQARKMLEALGYLD